ncbi:MAG: glycosyltransferase family 1 protein, partial [Burkholderiales bacterium]|nr:glycosyltransferase family 1 protein [Burkholderiales bacterium]
MPALIVFSHLRWDFVFQRPQHLMTRLAKHFRVFFVEEPVLTSGNSYFDIRYPMPGVSVLTPHTPVEAVGFHDEQLTELQKLLHKLIDEQDIEEYVVWFYTPMALPLLSTLQPRAVVYDCMDELQAFKNAPRQLVQRENALLKIANVVFTGGPSLYNAKRERHPNVHCFPSSVDAGHFEKAKTAAGEHRLQTGLPRPRLGFFGVIDERFDPELIAGLADAHPQWQIVLVGPVVKIDQATLPQRTNVHYFGQQSYAELPDFLRGWDVCLMPFALNESTRFISPTKTLEYMAAGLPIVSTPVTDVADIYSDIVYIASGKQEFIAACEQALGASADERQARAGKMQRAVAKTSWEITALKMRDLIEQACSNGPTDGARTLIERNATQDGVRLRKSTQGAAYR